MTHKRKTRGRKKPGARKFGGKTYKITPYGFATKKRAAGYGKQLQQHGYSTRVKKAPKTGKGKSNANYLVYCRKR